MKLSLLAVVFSYGFLYTSNSSNKHTNTANKMNISEKENQVLNKAYFASGCFWCVEAIYESVNGVEAVISGYSGGEQDAPNYNSVSMGQTDHAETVEVHYNPDKVSFDTLVDIFFGSHDPTQLNGQGPDQGKQYRSIAFYSNDQEKQIIEDYIAKLEKNGVYQNPIVTEVKAFKKFWKAEEYHQDYEKNNPNNPYVKNVSIPRLNRFKAKYSGYCKINYK